MEMIKKTLTGNSILLAIIAVLFTIMMLVGCENEPTTTNRGPHSYGEDEEIGEDVETDREVETSVSNSKLKLNEVSGVGEDVDKFYELINIGTEAIPLEGYRIYYNANSAAGGTLPTGKGNLTWTGLSTQSVPAGQLFSLIGRNTAGSFTTGLTAQRILIITLEDPAGNVIDKCVRAADTGAYAITDKSFSRIPDGTGDFYFTTPTPNATNGTTTAGLTKVPVESVVETPVVTPPTPTTGKLLILQAATPNKDGAVTYNFVELYNAGDTAVDLSGYSLQYAAGVSTTSTSDGTWSMINLTGTVQPHRSFLILGTKATTVPTVGTASTNTQYNFTTTGDFSTSFALSNDAFKVALMSNTTKLTVQNPFNIDGSGTKADGYVDMVGAVNTYKIYGFETKEVSDMSKQKSVRRISLIDTDNNSVDFKSLDYRGNAAAIGFKYPHNSAFGAWNPITGETE